MSGTGRARGGTGLVLASLLTLGSGGAAAPDEDGGQAEAAPGPAAIAAAGAARLPASSAMPMGGWLLPPPGYLDYCLRYRGRDQGCRP